ncbi:MAG: Nif3-like dinuclear metal center hexameric protein [Actinobacteria bacterium]|nr:MAG: Nif3-like dinuclear metal center hexameric protein [Actinomycetota bacterium]
MTDPAPTLGDVLAAMEQLYPSRLAEGWDAVGLVCGDPERPVRRILVAVDPVAEVVDEALRFGADLLITHHPLLLQGVHGVPATTPEGRVVMRLIEAGCALLCAHTNADAANPGVSDALARALGLGDLRPLQRTPESEGAQLLVVYVPPSHVDQVLDAAAAAGAGEVGDYRRCAFVGPGEGTFDAPAECRPHIGAAGERGTAPELRVELLVPAGASRAAVAAMLAAHPYEEPAYVVLPAADVPRSTGIGRVGEVSSPMTLAEFGDLVAAALPATEHGVRVAGDLAGVVRRVAVCGGAGDSLMGDARAAGADVYVTADLRHHRVQEHLDAGGCAVVDVAHWASEWPWCPQVAELLPQALADVTGAAPDSVDILVSEASTDPWSARLPSVP